MIKKLFICALPVLAMTACTSQEDVKVPANTSKEISFSAVNHVMSRNALVTDDADNGTFSTDNVMYVSALINDGKTPATKEVYFEDQLFKHNGSVWAAFDKDANGGAGDFAPIYYPYSGSLQFMAYSTAKKPTATWSYIDKSSFDQVVLPFGNTLDGAEDVLYSGSVVSVNDASAVTGSQAFALNHALALVSFEVKLATGVTASIKVNSITVEDAYLSGTLTVKNSSGTCAASWSAPSNQADMVVPGASAITLTPNAAAVKFGTGVLVVDQTPTSFTVNYDMTVSGTTYQGLTKTVDFAKGTIGTWAAGNKYVYTVILSPKQVTFTGSVNKWGNGGTEQETL